MECFPEVRVSLAKEFEVEAHSCEVLKIVPFIYQFPPVYHSNQITDLFGLTIFIKPSLQSYFFFQIEDAIAEK